MSPGTGDVRFTPLDDAAPHRTVNTSFPRR